MKSPTPSTSGPVEHGPSRSETLKSATTAAVKAVSGKTDATVAYSTIPNAKASADLASDQRLPAPPVKLTRDSVVRLRGAADALAVKLRYHDTATHVRRLPLSKRPPLSRQHRSKRILRRLRIGSQRAITLCL